MPQAVVQRVSSASVTVAGEKVAEIGEGMLILLGIGKEDDQEAVERLAAKILKLRIFDDEEGRPNLPLGEREILCVSQFTLYADVRKGNRPSYVNAAPPELAKPLYELFCERVGAKQGVFGATMKVASVNEGPFTLLIGDASRLY
jgi:D-tyrosyl-tRNA(Tyr) deacylase